METIGLTKEQARICFDALVVIPELIEILQKKLTPEEISDLNAKLPQVGIFATFNLRQKLEDFLGQDKLI